VKAIIIYDSLYGNTEKIANSVAQGIGGEVKVVKAGEAKAGEIGSYDLVLIGSPTQGGRQTAAVKTFLDSIPEGALKNKSVAAFDTRLTTKLVKLFGYAAGRIHDDLKEKGANLLAPAEPFYVNKGKGPALVDGEAERAAAWGKTIINGLSNK
jgi:flavodoxin I